VSQKAYVSQRCCNLSCNRNCTAHLFDTTSYFHQVSLPTLQNPAGITHKLSKTYNQKRERTSARSPTKLALAVFLKRK